MRQVSPLATVQLCKAICLARSLQTVSCWRTGVPLDFSKGPWLDLDRGIVTSTPAVHAALIAAIQQISEEERPA